MSNNKPISYDNLKCILRHLEPNLRFKLVQRSPSLANVDSIVPLKIRKLRFEPKYFEINDTTYTLGVIRKYRNGGTPSTIEKRNKEGGVSIDVDRYGIDIRETEEDGQQRVEQLEAFKNREMDREHRLQVYRHPRPFKKVDAIHFARQNIEACSLEILSYKLRQENAEPPFEQYLQLEIKCGGKVGRERVNYNRSFLNAKEYVLNKLFGVNGRTVEVSHLQIGYFTFDEVNARVIDQRKCEMRNPLLPLAPEKLEVRHLTACTDLKRVMDSVKPILWETPLKSLESSIKILIPELRQNPFVAGTERVIIYHQPTIDTFFEFTNEKVHICGDYFPRKEDMKNLVKNWLRRGFNIGRQFSMSFSTARSTENFLNVVDKMPNAKRRELEEIRHTAFPDCIILPVNNYSELFVYGAATAVEEKFYCNYKYIVKIKVQGKGCF
ncbi:unnamed protein product [Caenorhabditis brenneri]